LCKKYRKALNHWPPASTAICGKLVEKGSENWKSFTRLLFPPYPQSVHIPDLRKSGKLFASDANKWDIEGVLGTIVWKSFFPAF
jgi:hypothetical protein